MSHVVLCAYCHERPVTRRRGAKDCGRTACRVAHRVATRPDPRRCPYCDVVIVAKRAGRGGRPPATCGSAACEDARTKATREKSNAIQRQSFDPRSTSREPSAVVDRLLARARAKRLYEERVTGQRRYAVDPWDQRPDRRSGDGEVRLCEVGAWESD